MKLLRSGSIDMYTEAPKKAADRRNSKAAAEEVVSEPSNGGPTGGGSVVQAEPSRSHEAPSVSYEPLRPDKEAAFGSPVQSPRVSGRDAVDLDFPVAPETSIPGLKKHSKAQEDTEGREDSVLPESVVENAHASANMRRSKLDIASSVLNVHGDRFNNIIGVVIVLNAIMLGVETEYGDKQFLVLDQVFVFIFFAEMCLRINQDGFTDYIMHFSNLFDCTLVLASIADLVLPLVLSRVSGSSTTSGGGNKVLKMLRTLRVMRITRLLHMFRGLSNIMVAFMRALAIVGWVGLLTIIFNYMCAIFLTQVIGHNSDEFGQHEEEVQGWFGSISNCMRTLFVVITLNQWVDISYTLATRYNSFAVFMVAFAYIILTSFTMLSLITGVISEAMLSVQMADEVAKLQEVEQNKAIFESGVAKVLQHMDTDGSGSLSRDEVREALTSQTSTTLLELAALEIEMDAEELMYLFDRLHSYSENCKDENYDIDIDDVTEVLKHFTGTAKGPAVWDLKHKMASVRHDIQTEADSVVKRVAALDTRIARFTSGVDQRLDHLLKKFASKEDCERAEVGIGYVATGRHSL